MKLVPLLLVTLVAGCASTPEVPAWYSNLPPDTQESVYFVSKGVGRTKEASKQEAADEGKIALLIKLDQVLEPIAEQYIVSIAPSLDKEKVKTLMRVAPYQVIDGFLVQESGTFTTYALFKYHLGDALFLLNIRMQQDLERAMNMLAEEERRKLNEQLDKELIRYFEPNKNEWNVSYIEHWLDHEIFAIRFVWDDYLLPFSVNTSTKVKLS